MSNGEVEEVENFVFPPIPGVVALDPKNANPLAVASNTTMQMEINVLIVYCDRLFGALETTIDLFDMNCAATTNMCPEIRGNVALTNVGTGSLRFG